MAKLWYKKLTVGKNKNVSRTLNIFVTNPKAINGQSILTMDDLVNSTNSTGRFSSFIQKHPKIRISQLENQSNREILQDE